MRAVEIVCDGETYRLPAAPIGGRHLRAFSLGPAADDRDLFLEAPGLAADTRIEYDGTLEPGDGMRFYSAPRAMSAG